MTAAREERLQRHREANARYYATRREERAEKCRGWRDLNRERVDAYASAYREDHREANRTRSSEYYAAHKDHVLATSTAWKQENVDHVAEYRLTYNRANPDKARAWNRRRRVRANNGTGTHTAADEQAQLQRQHGLCYYCAGKVGKYHVDHAVPLSRGGSNDPSNIVVACVDCNLRKHTKLPHEFSGRLC